MQSIVIDAGPLIALFDASDSYHKAALSFIKQAKYQLVTNVAVITEVTFVLDFSVLAQCDFLNWVSQALIIDEATAHDIPRIAALMDKYKDLPADFADASLVALCERLDSFAVASIDRDFAVYRAHGAKPLHNVFFSLD